MAAGPRTRVLSPPTPPRAGRAAGALGARGADFARVRGVRGAGLPRAPLPTLPPPCSGRRVPSEVGPCRDRDGPVRKSKRRPLGAGCAKGVPQAGARGNVEGAVSIRVQHGSVAGLCPDQGGRGKGKGWGSGGGGREPKEGREGGRERREKGRNGIAGPGRIIWLDWHDRELCHSVSLEVTVRVPGRYRDRRVDLPNRALLP